MLPSILAKQLEKGLCDYIETTFPMSNAPFRGSVKRMLETPDSVFHEPYLSVRLPFRTAEEMPDCFKAIHPKFLPYVHQARAYERLTGDDGRSTLIATGTGSGKTECFLYPILEYCWQHRGEKGIKALIIYPMNALASDQAKRIAGLIWNSPELRGNVTAGMYVGGWEQSPCRAMSESGIITDRDVMLNRPPDILLTNYKMLDYLLVRPKDAMLWQDNGPYTLKYIVVDEFHTFDGAQGTDLACLLRRLKKRLGIDSGYLCCIGTSATMGAKEGANSILKYADEVFGERFEDDSVITEDRLQPEEFFSGADITEFSMPDSAGIEKLDRLIAEDDEKTFLETAAQCWFEGYSGDVLSDEGRLELGDMLIHHSFVQAAISLTKGGAYQAPRIAEDLKTNYPALAEAGDINCLIYSLYALISHARAGSPGHLRPFLFVQVQLWMRELRRWVAKVSGKNVTYALANDLNSQQVKQYLPVVNCRDCGATGWVTKLNERGSAEMKNLNAFYNLYFRGDDSVAMLFPFPHDEIFPDMVPVKLCPECLHVKMGESGGFCESCGADMIDVQIPSPIKTSGSKGTKQYVCPCCGSRRGLSLIGLRSATEISASISQMFASRFNDDKKTLAFSDNVQDAAHRAGFFNSRTWRFGLRTAVQTYVQDGGAGRSLADFTSGFTDYWRGRFDTEAYAGFFIAPNMTWIKAYEDMKENRKLKMDVLGKKLLCDINSRLAYEIMLEYGMGARIGRTLEKSGCSALTFDMAAIDRVAASVMEQTANELGALRNSDIGLFRRMTLGYLNIMRMNGAFDDSAFYAMAGSGGNTYLLSSDHVRWMPGRQSGRNTPRLLVEETPKFTGKYTYDPADSGKYADWAEACCGCALLDKSVYKAICLYIFAEALKEGLISALPSAAEPTVYGLNKERVFVSDKTVRFRCARCGSVFTAASNGAETWDGAPCLNRGCGGTLRPAETSELDYYGKLYSAGDLARINAMEHTGLLERDARERLENDFKRGRADHKNWDPNVLSCTPTLEMGIDIGDLSSIILCSMPPAQSQFLQRTGRSGRKDGNALTVAVANSRPHDLYFYADPMDMIEGAPQSPKIFLKASAVLARQFTAYCMDSWVKSGIGEDAIPKNVARILDSLKSEKQTCFPFNFLNYVKINLSELTNSFLSMFSTDLDTVTRAELRRFACGDKHTEERCMRQQILDDFWGLRKQRDALKSSIKDIGYLIKTIESKPKDSSYDEEIKELRSEQTALQNVYREINKKDVFNFLSDEGLLPNYAFPESGIILKAVLYRKEEPSDQETAPAPKHRYDKMVYEYSRGASSAISEFAPMNNFYVDGRKLTVNQVDLTTAQTAKWRLCPNCSHAQIEEAGKDTACCPNCGSPAWADSGQVRSMLKVQMVYSNMDYTRSLIGDESDDRKNVFYTKQMLVDVDEEHDIESAFKMNNDEFPFGYEFVKKAVLREINFGESDMVGEKLSVSGVDEVRRGFSICRYCGTIQSENEKKKHSAYCRVNKNPALDSDPFEECLFLYREFKTEILRLLIPATTMDSSTVRTESFVAAFMLGMKEYFGNVDHLRAAICDVPVADADYRKQYLVIYDSVPGGTGYLKQLMHEKNALTSVFEKALAVLENCTCKTDPQKDGCYHCLYAYRQSQNIGSISRTVAIRLLKAILSGRDNVEKIERLGSVSVNPLFDSELEKRFIEALNQTGNESRRVNVYKALVNNKEGYILKANDSTWEIEPQVTLDAAQGVSIKCKPDFVIRPMRADGRKPVAIFTDGFQFHKDKTADDTLKRISICRSNNYRVWALSWRDVQSIFETQGDYCTDTLNAMSMPYGSRIYQPTVAAAHAESLRTDKMSSFELLMRYLSEPDAENMFAAHARGYSLSLLDPAKMSDAAAFCEWRKTVVEADEQTHFLDYTFEEGRTLFGQWSPRTVNAHFSALSGVAASMLKEDRDTPIAALALLEDTPALRSGKFESEWNGFWHFFNVMQFNGAFIALSKTGLDENVYLALPLTEKDATQEPQALTSENDPWAGIYELLFEEEAKTFAVKLSKNGIPAPDEVGYELSDNWGAVVAAAELIWLGRKIAYLTSDQLCSAEIFAAMGWTVINDQVNILSIDFGGDRK